MNVLRNIAIALGLAFSVSGEAIANPIDEVLIFCDPCKISEMPNYATGQGVGIRYVGSLEHNVLKRFEVKVGSGTPNIAPYALLPSSAEVNGIEPSVDFSMQSTLVAIPTTMDPDVRLAFDKLYAAKNAAPSGFTPNTRVPFNIGIALGNNQSGQPFNPVLYGAYCEGGPEFNEFNDRLSQFLVDAPLSDDTVPQSIRDINFGTRLLADIGFGETMGAYESVYWGMFQPQWTAQFCNGAGDCAEFLIKPGVGVAQWQFSRTSTNYGAGQAYPSLCSEQETWNYVFTDPDAAARLRRGLTGIGVPFTRIAGAGNSYIYVSCARVENGPFLGCTTTEEHF